MECRGKPCTPCRKSDSTPAARKRLHVVDLENGRDKIVWAGRDVGQVLCNEDNGALQFFGTKETGEESRIWRFSFGAEEALPWISNSRDQNGDSVVLQQLDFGLLPQSGGVSFYVKMAPQPGTLALGANVRIWRYDDEFEGSDELPVPPPKPVEYFQAVAYPGSSKTIDHQQQDRWAWANKNQRECGLPLFSGHDQGEYK